MATAKLTVLRRELAELFQPNALNNGWRALLFGALAILFATRSMELLLSTNTTRVDLIAGVTMARPMLALFWLALAATCIAWWYWSEYNARRPRR